MSDFEELHGEAAVTFARAINDCTMKTCATLTAANQPISTLLDAAAVLVRTWAQSVGEHWSEGCELMTRIVELYEENGGSLQPVARSAPTKVGTFAATSLATDQAGAYAFASPHAVSAEAIATGLSMFESLRAAGLTDWRCKQCALAFLSQAATPTCPECRGEAERAYHGAANERLEDASGDG